jgi:hypothetical protein
MAAALAHRAIMRAAVATSLPREVRQWNGAGSVARPRRPSSRSALLRCRRRNRRDQSSAIPSPADKPSALGPANHREGSDPPRRFDRPMCSPSLGWTSPAQVTLSRCPRPGWSPTGGRRRGPVLRGTDVGEPGCS